MPKIGHPVENTPGDIRELIFGRYVVRYEIRGNDLLYILRIWHGKENAQPTDYLQKLQMVFHCFFGITLKQT
jgi:plasmid stabilization system protein ParE